MSASQNALSLLVLLTPLSRVLLEKLTGFQLVKKFPTLYGNRRFITAFTGARHLPYPQSRSEVSVHDSQQNHFLWRGVVDNSPNPQAGGPPLVGCPRLLIQYTRSYPPYWRPFLHPQPEDAPCRGDRDPLITALLVYYRLKVGNTCSSRLGFVLVLQGTVCSSSQVVMYVYLRFLYHAVK